MDSAFSDNYRFLARYNRWFNQRLYGDRYALRIHCETMAAIREACHVGKRCQNTSSSNPTIHP